MTTVALLVAAWILAAYVVLPRLWRHHEHRPGLARAPLVTETPEGIPGDPLNLALVGCRADVEHAFAAAGWAAAQALGVRSGLGIAESVLLHRPDPEAPVSTLVLFGRAQDLAFERQVGTSAKMRHHVRLWHAEALADRGDAIWLGAATFDRGVGVSHRTGQITHHIAPDVDTERDVVMRDLAASGRVTRRYQVTGVGPTLAGRNGGGDRYFTDGEVTVAVLRAATDANPASPPQDLPSPSVVRAKNRVFAWLRPVLRGRRGGVPDGA